MAPAPGVFFQPPFAVNTPATAVAPSPAPFVALPASAAGPPVASKEEVARNTLEFQRRRAEAGAAHAQYDLGVRYLNGDAVEKDLKAARKWLTAAANQGHTQALKKLEDLSKAAERVEK